MGTSRKSLIFGLDIGTTSIGFAVIDHDNEAGGGEIRRLGVRIFPEARDPKGTPLNQQRRGARLRRRQLRRRRDRRRRLGDRLFKAGLLPAGNPPDWDEETKKLDPYELRKRAFEGETLSPYEIGRAIYHLAQRRHFRERDVDEISDDVEDDKKAQSAADKKPPDKTLGAWLAERDEEASAQTKAQTRHT